MNKFVDLFYFIQFPKLYNLHLSRSDARCYGKFVAEWKLKVRRVVKLSCKKNSDLYSAKLVECTIDPIAAPRTRRLLNFSVYSK